MLEKDLPELSGSVIYFVGVKGTGMAALAELFRTRGAIVTGSDVPDKFYTDVILAELGVPVYECFDENNIPEATKLLIYSAAYNPDSHPEIVKAKEMGIPIFSYAEALGFFSRQMPAAGICGVHGKTTTTAIAGTIMKEYGLAGSVLTGSAAANFDGHSTLVKGGNFFIAETCEYRRNFLNFSPDFLVITSVEPDHLDYYKDYNDILSAFVEYGEKLSENGRIIYCADDEGAVQAASIIKEKRADIKLTPYGFKAEGDYKILLGKNSSGQQQFKISRFGDFNFVLKVPGRHNILNSTAAAALVSFLAEKENFKGNEEEIIAKALLDFRGTKRRSEVLGEAGGVIFIDDYGHHPKAIKTTLAGLKDFYPDRRLIVDFMSHTYSRTEALIDDFAESFLDADMVSLHKIYASAREKCGKISGQDLYNKVCKNQDNVIYNEEVMDVYDKMSRKLKPGDLFVTMGAGDNWKLGYKLYENFSEDRQE
ncbi:MAG: UDP-N-acetylmuramate--L-alanine ligase [Spirochaetales bacterium]|nr:UDP-N-acetylmuramate--L-alanine ligase [Spirochaetales bacterium]